MSVCPFVHKLRKNKSLHFFAAVYGKLDLLRKFFTSHNRLFSRDKKIIELIPVLLVNDFYYPLVNFFFISVISTKTKCLTVLYTIIFVSFSLKKRIRGKLPKSLKEI